MNNSINNPLKTKWPLFGIWKQLIEDTLKGFENGCLGKAKKVEQRNAAF